MSHSMQYFNTTFEMDVMAERYFARFDIKMSFGRISYLRNPTDQWWSWDASNKVCIIIAQNIVGQVRQK